MSVLKNIPTAKPVSVSNVTEVSDKDGHYIGESRVVLFVRGNCVPRALFAGALSYVQPEARGGKVFEIKYMYDADISVIEYRFCDGFLRNRLKTSDRFRNKMLKQIAKQKNENIK